MISAVLIMYHKLKDFEYKASNFKFLGKCNHVIDQIEFDYI